MTRSTNDVDTTEEERVERRQRLGRIIRNAREEADFSQGDLGVALGDIPQTTISRWERGLVDLTIEQIRDIEIALGRRPGELLIEAGYVDGKVTVKRRILDMVPADPELHPTIRDVATGTYKGWIEVSKRLFVKEPVTASRRRR